MVISPPVVALLQDCWDEDASKRPRFEDIIISLRGLLESASNRHKLQKTLTGIALMQYATLECNCFSTA